MGHNEAGPTRQQLAQCQLQPRLRQRIDRTRRLVEEDQAWVRQQRPGETDELTLADREARPLLAHLGVQPRRQRLEEVQTIQRRRGGADLLIGGLRPAETDIFHDRPSKQNILLLHHPHLPVQGMAGECANLAIVHEDFPLRGQVKFRDEINDGAFATAGVPDQRDRLSGLGVKANVVQHQPRRIIAKRQMTELNAGARKHGNPKVEPGFRTGFFILTFFEPVRRPGPTHLTYSRIWQRRCCGIIRPIRRHIDQTENPLRSGHGEQRLGVLVADDGDGGEKLVREQEKRDEPAHRHVAMKYAPAADQEQQGHKELAVEFKQGREDGRGAGQRDVVARMVGQQIPEKTGIGLLPHKALRHPDAVDRFREGGGDAAKALLGGARILAELHPEVPVEQPEDGGQCEHDKEKNPVAPHHHHGGKHHGSELNDADEQHILNANPH